MSPLYQISIYINHAFIHSLIVQQLLLYTVVRCAKQSANYKHIAPLMTFVCVKAYGLRANVILMCARSTTDSSSRNKLTRHLDCEISLLLPAAYALKISIPMTCFYAPNVLYASAISQLATPMVTAAVDNCTSPQLPIQLTLAIHIEMRDMLR